MAIYPATFVYKGGISTGNYSTLSAADTEAAGGYLYLDTDWTLAGDTTLSSQLVPAGGKIKFNSHKLTLSKEPVDVPYVPLFDVSSGGSVVLPTQTTSWLHWFNPAANGSTDDTLAVQAWCLSARGRRALPGNYKTETGYFVRKADEASGG